MKRYEKYKPSGIEWIGEVPEHWNQFRIKYALSRSAAGVWGDDEKGDDNDIICYRIADFDYDHGGLNLDDLTTRNIEPKQLEGRIVKEGDLLIEKSGGGEATPVGRVVKVNSDQRATYTNFIHSVSIKEGYDSNYLYYYFNTLYALKINMLFFNQTTGLQNLKVGDYLSQTMYLPLLSEQEAIAAYLDARCGDIDKVVATQEKRIALLNEMKQSVITQAVTRGLNPDAKMKNSGVEWIGLVPEHWEVKKLKFVSNSISKGAGITKEQVVEDGDTQCVRYGEIYTKYNHSFDSCVSATNKDLHPVLQYFGYGDILFTCTGELVEEIGKSVVYLGHERCLAGGDILVVSHNQDPSFLNYALNSYAQIQKSEGRAKLKVVHISTYDISNLLLALPPIEEQKQIADEIDRRCSSIDKQIGAVTRQIELLREYKQSLITDVVTGKVKVC